MSLIDKIRKARETTITVDGHAYTLRRPTDLEAARLAVGGDLLDFVVGWDLVEIDLVSGGSDVKVPFDQELFREWVADQPSVWKPLTDAVRDAYRAHAAAREEQEKN